MKKQCIDEIYVKQCLQLPAIALYIERSTTRLRRKVRYIIDQQSRNYGGNQSHIEIQLDKRRLIEGRGCARRIRVQMLV